MSEFDQLLNNILNQKPELTREDILDRIRQKMEKIGPGYLTEQGALFLIAEDLEIRLDFLRILWNVRYVTKIIALKHL